MKSALRPDSATARRPERDSASAPLLVAEAVREACRLAVAEAWEDAGVQGLCVEGRCEVALGALERLDLRTIAETALAGASPAGPARDDPTNANTAT